jgi:hypothetical protein
VRRCWGRRVDAGRVAPELFQSGRATPTAPRLCSAPAFRPGARRTPCRRHRQHPALARLVAARGGQPCHLGDTRPGLRAIPSGRSHPTVPALQSLKAESLVDAVACGTGLQQSPFGAGVQALRHDSRSYRRAVPASPACQGCSDIEDRDRRSRVITKTCGSPI